jgi:peptidoglycan/LPS O-acetylase OafA/YrhL
MHGNDSSETASGRILGFDGLRAVAVLMVLVMHKTGFGTTSRLGFFGVLLFFLLSGYLIIGQLHQSRLTIERRMVSRRSALLRFWQRRAFRIFPAYYVLLCALGCYYLISGRALHGFGYHLTYLSNLYFKSDMSQFGTTFAHFWSLAVEEQFYLLFAPLLLFVPAMWHLRLCAAVLAGSLLYRAVLVAGGTPTFVVYIDSLINFGLLALGGLIYLARKQIVAACRRLRLSGGFAGLGILGLFLLLASATSVLAGPDSTAFQIVCVVEAGLGACLIANVVADQNNVLVAMLDIAPLVLLGRLSYGIYLYNDYAPADLPERLGSVLAKHAPGLTQILSAGSWAAISQWLALLGIGLSFALTFLAAYCSWNLLEAPMLRLRDRLTRTRTTKAEDPATRRGDREAVRIITELAPVEVSPVPTWRAPS